MIEEPERIFPMGNTERLGDAFIDDGPGWSVGGIVRYKVRDPEPEELPAEQRPLYCIDTMFSMDRVENNMGVDIRPYGIALGEDVCGESFESEWNRFAHYLRRKYSRPFAVSPTFADDFLGVTSAELQGQEDIQIDSGNVLTVQASMTEF